MRTKFLILILYSAKMKTKHLKKEIVMKKILTVALAMVMLCSVMLAGCKKEEEKKAEGGMKIATSTGDFDGYAKTLEAKIDLLHQSGFRYIDLSFYGREDNAKFLADDWKEYTQSVKKLAEEKDMEFVQAHAMGGNVWKSEKVYDEVVTATKRAIEVCAELGIPNIVVHAPYTSKVTSKEEFYERTLAYYQEYFPLMEQTGVNVLVENSFYSELKVEHYFYSGEELAAFLDYANHPQLKACWDTGHANIQGTDQHRDIVALGDRLAAVHIADNLGEHDDHLMPYQGTVNMDAVMTGLLKIGYTGAFTFEAANTLNYGTGSAYPRNSYNKSQKTFAPSVELKVEAEKLLLSVGKHILTKYEIQIAE